MNIKWNFKVKEKPKFKMIRSKENGDLILIPIENYKEDIGSCFTMEERRPLSIKIKVSDIMLKVGDKVKIRGDLEVGQKFNKCDFTKEMKKYRGKIAKIEFICGRFILLDIDNQEFGWTEDMFDRVEEDNKMKELTFKEIIANIKEDEVWESNDISIFKTKDDISISWKNDDYDNGVLIFDDEKFKLTKRKEYTFEEAF